MEKKEEIRQQTAQGVKLDSVFDTLDQSTEQVNENPVAEAQPQDVLEKPRVETTEDANTKKSKLPKIAVITAAAVGLAVVIGVGVSSITTLLNTPPPVATVATQTATQSPQSPDAASVPAPDLATSAPAFQAPPGIEVERVKGIEIQDSLYSDTELIERAKMIEALTSTRPPSKMTCDSLAQDEEKMFGKSNDIKDGLHHRWSTYEKRCNDIGANEYFKCSPTGFSWDLSVPGCELGIESALVLRNDNIRSQIADLPETLKTRFLAILTR